MSDTKPIKSGGHFSAKDLALFVKASANAREDSFDKEGADAATAAADAKREAEPDNLYAGIVDYKQFYRMTMLEACEQQCPKDLAYPVYLLLGETWNDVHQWADDILGLTPKDTVEELAMKEERS
jgi:hypothetical protein